MRTEEYNVVIAQFSVQPVEVDLSLVCIALAARVLVVAPCRCVEDDLLVSDSQFLSDPLSVGFGRHGKFVVSRIALFDYLVSLAGLVEVPRCSKLVCRERRRREHVRELLSIGAVFLLYLCQRVHGIVALKDIVAEPLERSPVPALQVYLTFARILVVQHAVVGDPVLGLAERLVVRLGAELHDARAAALIFFCEIGVLLRLLEAPDESEVLVLRCSQHVLIHRLRRVTVSPSRESTEVHQLVIELAERIVKHHLGLVSLVAACPEDDTEGLVLLCYVEYYFLECFYDVHTYNLSI